MAENKKDKSTADNWDELIRLMNEEVRELAKSIPDKASKMSLEEVIKESAAAKRELASMGITHTPELDELFAKIIAEKVAEQHSVAPKKIVPKKRSKRKTKK